MQKDGNWIAAMTGNLKVRRVDVEANEVLELVELFIGDRHEAPRAALFLDRVEARRMHERLGECVARISGAEKPAPAGKPPFNRENNPGVAAGSIHTRAGDAGPQNRS